MRQTRCHDCIFGVNIKLREMVCRVRLSAMPWTCVSVDVRHRIRYLRRWWHGDSALPTPKGMPSPNIDLIVVNIAPGVKTFSLV